MDPSDLIDKNRRLEIEIEYVRTTNGRIKEEAFSLEKANIDLSFECERLKLELWNAKRQLKFLQDYNEICDDGFKECNIDTDDMAEVEDNIELES
jgi:hypothetical protein